MDGKDDEGWTILSRHEGGTSGYERGRCARWNWLWAHSLKKDAFHTFPMKMEERGTRDCNMQMRTEISSPSFASPIVVDRSLFPRACGRGGSVHEIWAFFCCCCCHCCCCCCQFFTIVFFVDAGKVRYGELNGIGLAFV